jgi:hypothetical protein
MADHMHHQQFFATLGQINTGHVDRVNQEATTRLEQLLQTPVDAPGRGFLLRAPRAGFGKTHLVGRVRQLLSSTHEFLPLVLINGSVIDPSAVIESALRRLIRQLPAGGGLTALDLLARRLLALALQPLVASGEVPCQDRDAALLALRQRPVETFDFHQPSAVTAQWTMDNFEVLGPRLALELSRRTGVSLNETSIWLAALFRFAIAAPEQPGRAGILIRTVLADAGIERYSSLLALLTSICRVVMVADDLEGLHSQPQAALKFVSFLAAVRHDAPRADAVVSVNDDVWASAFEGVLSGGLLDRLAEVEIRLNFLTDDAIYEIIESRLPGRFAHILPHLQLRPEERYARRVLRVAAEIEASLDPVPVSPRAALDVPVPVSLPQTSSVFSIEPQIAPVVAAAESPATPVTPAAEAPEAVAEEAPAPSPFQTLEATVAPAPESLLTETPTAPVFSVEPVAKEAPVHEEQAAAAVNEEAIPEPPPIPTLTSQPIATGEVTSFFSVGAPAAPAEAPESSPAPASEPTTAENATCSGPVEPPTTDRIEDLLRQFRERYGRE